MFDLWAWSLDTYKSVTGDESFVYFGPLSVWLCQVVPFCIFGVLFTLLDIYHRPERLYKLKIQEKVEYAPEGSSKNPSLVQTILRVSLAFAAELPALLFFQYACHRWLGTGILVTYRQPTWFEIFFHGITLTLLSEVGFYFTHRSLHHFPFLYRHIHSYHHQFRAPIAIAAEAQHPLEMIWCTAFGMTFWPFFCGTHAQVVIIGTIIGTYSSMHDHCGYWLYGSGQQPFFHDWHHEYVNGNFGFLGLMDSLFGTSAKWKQTHEDRRKRVLERLK